MTIKEIVEKVLFHITKRRRRRTNATDTLEYIKGYNQALNDIEDDVDRLYQDAIGKRLWID